MKALELQTPNSSFSGGHLKFNLKGKSIEEQVKLCILRDLWNLNWKVDFKEGKIEVAPPPVYDKTVIKDAMSIKRN